MKIFYNPAHEIKYITFFIIIMCLVGPVIYFLIFFNPHLNPVSNIEFINFLIKVIFFIMLICCPWFLFILFFRFSAFKTEKFIVGKEKFIKILKKIEIKIKWDDVREIGILRKNSAVYYNIKSENKMITINKVIIDKLFGFKEFIEKKSNLKINY